MAYQAAAACLVSFTTLSCLTAVLNHYLVGSRVLAINSAPATRLDELVYWLYHYGPPAASAAAVPLGLASLLGWRVDPARFCLIHLCVGLPVGLIAGWLWELWVVQAGPWNGVAWEYVVSPWVSILASLAGYKISAVAAARRDRLSQNRCRRCGYSLVGILSPLCPECGSAQSSDTARSA